MARTFRRMARNGLILLLVLGMVACGANAPNSVVEEALQYEISHAKESPAALVGVELLDQWSQVKSVQVKSQSAVDLYADGTVYPGVNVRGVYTVAVRTPNRKSRYKRTEPFALTLAHWVDEETERDRWLLAYPIAASEGRSPQPEWRLNDFLPQPEPVPEVEKVETPVLDGSRESTQLSSQEATDIVEGFDTQE